MRDLITSRRVAKSRIMSTIYCLFMSSIIICSCDKEDIKPAPISDKELLDSKVSMRTMQSAVITGYSSPGTTYYVATTGNENNPGTITQPWKTISKAAATLTSGQSVLVRGGTYNEVVNITISGADNNWITYSSYPGETVVISGIGKNVQKEHGLVDVRANYIRITGFQVKNSKCFGISGYSVTQIMIDSNYTYETVSSGIFCRFSNGVLIDNNEVERACNGGWEECITVGRTENFEIKNNRVHHNVGGLKGGEGIDAKSGSQNGSIHHNYVHDLTNRLGIYVDAYAQESYNIEVYNNIVHDANTGIAIASERGGPISNIKVYNNIVYHTKNYGIIIASWLTPGTFTDIFLYNNTIYDIGNTNTWGEGLAIENATAVSGIKVLNNIISQCKTAQLSITNPELSNYLITNNLINGVNAVYGNNPIIADPLFVNSGVYNFHITSGSPAINASSTLLSPAFDMDGQLRPNGAISDVGADEYY